VCAKNRGNMVKYLQNLKRAQELWDTVMKKHPR